MSSKSQEGTVKNLALILAGGIGARTNLATPKQFVTVFGKPIIIYTLEKFNQNNQIDDIVVVVLDGWQTVMARYVQQYNLYKVKHIVTGGNCGQASIRNGMEFLRLHYDKNDIVIIHDSVRPLVTDETINLNISSVLLYGTAVTVIPTTEALLYSEDGRVSSKVLDRTYVVRTQTPQSLRLEKLIEIHERAAQLRIRDSVATCALLTELGETVHLVYGINSNFKITTESDIRLFQAYLKSSRIVGDS